jgi:hypothetical protein
VACFPPSLFLNHPFHLFLCLLIGILFSIGTLNTLNLLVISITSITSINMSSASKHLALGVAKWLDPAKLSKAVSALLTPFPCLSSAIY